MWMTKRTLRADNAGLRRQLAELRDERDAAREETSRVVCGAATIARQVDDLTAEAVAQRAVVEQLTTQLLDATAAYTPAERRLLGLPELTAGREPGVAS